MAHLRETMVFYAPTVNSYKRYQAESWAPTGIAWSYDNRTAGFRVVGRVEYGEEFAAAVARPGIFAVQFHPEKSQSAGRRMLDAYASWIAAC